MVKIKDRNQEKYRSCTKKSCYLKYWVKRVIILTLIHQFHVNASFWPFFFTFVHENWHFYQKVSRNSSWNRARFFRDFEPWSTADSLEFRLQNLNNDHFPIFIKCNLTLELTAHIELCKLDYTNCQKIYLQHSILNISRFSDCQRNLMTFKLWTLIPRADLWMIFPSYNG